MGQDYRGLLDANELALPTPFPPPFITSVDYSPLNTNETKDITIDGGYFTTDSTVTITNGTDEITVNSVTCLIDNLLTVNITTEEVSGFFDVIVDNGNETTLVNGLEVTSVVVTKYKNVFDSANKDNLELSNTLPSIRSFHFKFTLDSSINSGSPAMTMISRYTGNISTGSSERIDVSFFAGVLKFGVFISGANKSISSNSNSWTAGQEYDVHWISNSIGGMKLYIDGVVQTSTNANTNAMPTSTGNIYFGGNIVVDIRYISVKIREVALWSVDRTPTEITNDLTNSPDGTETNLIAYYPLTEGSGSSIDSIPLPSYQGTLQTSSVTPGYIDANMWEVI